MATAAAALPRTRNQAVDLVKTVAICAVIVTHVTAPAFGMGDVGSAPWLTALFWASVSHASVPLFLMASGALLLDPGRELTLRKLYTKNFPRLLIALLFWAVCYKLFIMVLFGGVTVPGLIQAGKELVLFRHEEHLYYLHIMLLVYAFLPLTRLVSCHAPRHVAAYLLGLWALLGIIYPTVKDFWPFTLLVGIPQQWRMNMTYASIGYTLLGWYLSSGSKDRRRWLWAGCAAAGIAAGFIGSWAASNAAGSLRLGFLEGMGVPMCLLAVGIYQLCGRARLPAWAVRLTEWISRGSFCVFLVHIFFLKTFAHFGLTAQVGPAIVTVPMMTLLLLGCSMAVYALLRRIPVVNRWLI